MRRHRLCFSPLSISGTVVRYCLSLVRPGGALVRILELSALHGKIFYAPRDRKGRAKSPKPLVAERTVSLYGEEMAPKKLGLFSKILVLQFCYIVLQVQTMRIQNKSEKNIGLDPTLCTNPAVYA